MKSIILQLACLPHRLVTLYLINAQAEALAKGVSYELPSMCCAHFMKDKLTAFDTTLTIDKENYIKSSKTP